MKSIKVSLIKWLALGLVVALSACASTKQATFSSADDVKLYKVVRLSDLAIASDEATEGANEANERIKSYYMDAMAKAVTTTNRNVVSAADVPAQGRVLVIDGRLDVHYGSRALRYWVGFGAGKGSATITLTARDGASGQEKYKDVRTVELTMGAFGGSFEDMIKARIGEQIQQFTTKSQQ